MISWDKSKGDLYMYMQVQVDGASMRCTRRLVANEFICWPFALSKRGRIPVEITEKLQIDGFCSVVVMYDQPPLCSMVQLAWSSFLSISIWPFCVAKLKSEGRVWRPSHCTIYPTPYVLFLTKYSKYLNLTRSDLILTCVTRSPYILSILTYLL